MPEYSKIKQAAEIVRSEMTDEEKAAALQGAAFHLLISAPRKTSHSASEGQAYTGLLLAALGGVMAPPDIWRGYGWSFASRAEKWAEIYLPAQGYPTTRAGWLDLAEVYYLHYYLNKLREMLRSDE